MESYDQLIVAIVVPLLSFAAAAYTTRSQLRQAEIARVAEEKKSDNEHALALERFKKEVEARLWERVRDEIEAERTARRELTAKVDELTAENARLRAEIEAERVARRELTAKVDELTDENARLRKDNAALMAVVRKQGRV